ncbi:type II toxin-antitoxin system HipA family toxin (plasmid) [Stutzerimonas frequens]|uniref:type II toxin-antitoxin system HipA family toxin n=1 Tax=Stutzerimonas frequens TaxID=2968969 RepID=UPI002DBEB74F|nr:type II toxin-antitoxin system HipA family toxin [Stutzerimonas frequens]WRW29303.1 type II toxin-antitoxin system HipA family toxin [Stutzerimonas frequens]
MSRQHQHLNVYVHQQAVGRLARSAESERGSVFAYLGDVAPELAIALAMPVAWEPYNWQQGLHPIFEMNMPEGVLRDELMRRFSKAIKGFDDFALLSVVGQHQLGRLRVSTGSLVDTPPDSSVADLLIHDGAKDLFADLLTTYAQYSGVSGVQPKVLLRDAGQDVERVTQKGATHLIKSWREGEYNELAANEFFCMRAAGFADIPVPEVQLSATGKLLAVTRFDLTNSGYLGHEDFCALSAFNTGQKYDGTHEGIARLIKAYVSPARVSEALFVYFKMVALSAGVQNGDAHLKNFGVLYDHAGEGGDVWMCPAYDVVSTTPYIPKDSFALQLGGSKAWPKEKMLVRFGRTACGLTEGMCKRALEEVADGIADALGELVTYQKAHESFTVVGNAMQQAWNAGVSRSLLAEGRAVVVDMARGDDRGGE